MKRIIQFVSVFLLVFTFNLTTLAQIKVACIGNSITYGYGLSTPSTQSYPARMQVLLGNEYEVRNFGISSRTLLKNGDRPYWNESVYTQSLAFEPDIVFIMLGTNDAKLDLNWIPHGDEFSNDYKALIESYTSLPSAPRIYICKIVPAFKDIWAISNTIINNEINPIIQQVAFEEGRNHIDMYNEMNNQSWFIADGIHPNAAGAQAMADYVVEVMQHDTLVILQDGNTLIGPEGARYQWYLNNVPIEIGNGGQNQSYAALESGDYKVAVTISSNRTTIIFSATYHFEYVTHSYEDLELNNSKMVVFPNPVVNRISFNQFNEKASALNLYTVDGKAILRMRNIKPGDDLNISTENLSDGIYLYKIQCVDNRNLYGKFIVNK